MTAPAFSLPPDPRPWEESQLAEAPEPMHPCYWCGCEVLPEDDIAHEGLPVGIVHAECSKSMDLRCGGCGDRDLELDRDGLCEVCADLMGRQDAGDELYHFGVEND